MFGKIIKITVNFTVRLGNGSWNIRISDSAEGKTAMTFASDSALIINWLAPAEEWHLIPNSANKRYFIRCCIYTLLFRTLHRNLLHGCHLLKSCRFIRLPFYHLKRISSSVKPCCSVENIEMARLRPTFCCWNVLTHIPSQFPCPCTHQSSRQRRACPR